MKFVSADNSSPKSPIELEQGGPTHSDPLKELSRASEQQLTAKPSKANPGGVRKQDFKDVTETGKWGSITKREVYVVIGVILAVVVGVAVVTVKMVANQTSSTPGVAATTPVAPTSAPTILATPEDKFQELKTALEGNALLASLAWKLPEQATGLNGLSVDPVVMAARFAIESTTSGSVLDLFALAHLYHGTQGANWTSHERWMSPAIPACGGWHGVVCNANQEIVEIDLANNNLVGEIPSTILLFPKLRIVWLNGNKLTGPIPGDVIANMPKLYILYLQNNQLTGEIPTNLRDNGILRTLYIQGNDLEGPWPEVYCPVCDDEGCTPHPFFKFGLDCLKNECPYRGCCDLLDNCYQS